MARAQPRPPIRSLSSYQDALKTKKLSPLHSWAIICLAISIAFNLAIIICSAVWIKILPSAKKAKPGQTIVYDNL
jgi:hypothetical protein